MCKILLTVPNLDCTASPWREAMGLARNLPAERYKLTICALREDGVAESRPMLEAMGVRCFVARFRPSGRGLRRLLESFKDENMIKEHGPFDLQHSMDFTSSPFEAIMSRRHSRTFLFNQRNMNEDGHLFLLKLKVRFASRIICLSEAVLQLMQGLSPANKLAKVYPGLEMDHIPCCQRHPPQERPFKLLMVAHIARRKRFEDGLCAFAKLAREFPALRLDIAGEVADAAYLDELKQIIRTYGIGDRVTFLGPRKDIFVLMREADALLHTAESEAFGMVIIEAMAVGLPVIAPAIQGPKEILVHQQSGLLVAPGDVLGYVAAVRLLVQKPELGRQLASNARKRVEGHFSARRMAEETSAIYSSLCPRAFPLSIVPSPLS
jgi:glycosyltransferase involved in cell wall biosynthesis